MMILHKTYRIYLGDLRDFLLGFFVLSPFSGRGLVRHCGCGCLCLHPIRLFGGFFILLIVSLLDLLENPAS